MMSEGSRHHGENSALQYREATDPTEIVDKIVRLQARIDALDSAIEDELQLEKSRTRRIKVPKRDKGLPRGHAFFEPEE
jgi:hypothetical protein